MKPSVEERSVSKPRANSEWRDNRFINAIQISMVSSSSLTNLPTALTSLVFRPLLNVLLLVAVLASVGVTNIRDAAYASIVLSFGLSVLNGPVSQVTNDRNIGVAQSVISHGFWNPPYWIGKLVVPMLLGIVPAVLSALTVFAFSGANDVSALVRVLWLIPLAAFTGALVGIAASIASFALSDPYMISNILDSVLLITAGVVIPLSLYPTWLAWIARFLPFTAAIEAIRTAGSAWPLVLRELIVALVWLTVGLLIARRVTALIRSGKRSQEIW